MLFFGFGIGRSLWMTLFFSLLLPLLAFTPLAHAVTYYVSPNGLDPNPGTLAAPWKTIQQAADTMRPGDTVVILPGVYVEAVDILRSGTAAAYITYQAMPRAVMESPNPGKSLEALDIHPGVSYIRLQGFELRGGFSETIFVRAGAHHIEIRDCDIHDNHSGVWWSGSFDGLLERCLIHDNTGPGVLFRAYAHDIRVRDTDSYANDDGAGCGGDADGFSADETAYQLTFEGCTAFGNSEDGFDLKAANVLIDRATIYNNCNGVKLWNEATLQNSLIYGNASAGVNTTSIAVAGGTVTRLLNNTIAANLKAVAGKALKPYRLKLFNNILSSDGKVFDFSACIDLTENFNIFYRPNHQVDHIVQRPGCGVTSQTRRYSGDDIESGVWHADSGQGVNSRALDPLYVNPVAGDFSLLSSSPAIDAGWSVVALAVDLDGRPRPLQAGVDIGAYEFSLSSPDTIPPSKPTLNIVALQ